MKQLFAAGAGALLVTACADAYGPTYSQQAYSGSYGVQCVPGAPVAYAGATDPCAGGTVYPVSSRAAQGHGHGSGYAHGGAKPVSHYGPAGPVQPSPHAYGTHALQGLRGPIGGKYGFRPHVYAGLGGSYVTMDGYDGELVTLTGRGGAQMTPWLSAEVEASRSIGSAEGYELDYQLAGFARLSAPQPWRVKPFVRAGYQVARLGEVGDDEGFSIDSFVFGAGAEVAVSPRSALRFDYTRPENLGDETFDQFTASYQVKF